MYQESITVYWTKVFEAKRRGGRIRAQCFLVWIWNNEGRGIGKIKLPPFRDELNLERNYKTPHFCPSSVITKQSNSYINKTTSHKWRFLAAAAGLHLVRGDFELRTWSQCNALHKSAKHLLPVCSRCDA